MIIEFSKKCLAELKTKEQQAEAIIWYHMNLTGENEASILIINQYFEEAFLPQINITRLKNAFSKSKRVCRGSKAGVYKLTVKTITEYDGMFGYIWAQEPAITDKAGIISTPFLANSEISEAQQMAELYIILHCYENSVRKLVEDVLSYKLGLNWWDVAANAALKGKLKSRKETEEKNKWLTPRGSSPLYYVDWGDLLSLIRKYEPEFLPYIKDTKFVELRFEEMEKIRNITAHNGYLANEEDFQRVLLSFRDWCRQVR